MCTGGSIHWWKDPVKVLQDFGTVITAKHCPITLASFPTERLPHPKHSAFPRTKVQKEEPVAGHMASLIDDVQVNYKTHFGLI